MSILFTQEWNVVRGLEDEYEKFVSESLIPRCNKLGLISVGGFYVQAGCGPQIVSIKSVESLEKLFKVLADDEFQAIKNDLKKLVSHYGSRILVQNRKLGPESYSIQKGVWKFNQYFDIRPGMQEGYDDFMTNEFIPEISALDYVEFSREWKILIGGEREMHIELSFLDPVDIGRLLGSDVFHRLTYRLTHLYVDNFQNRILRTTERFDKARWFRL